jgi:hypothetical protein
MNPFKNILGGNKKSVRCPKCLENVEVPKDGSMPSNWKCKVNLGAKDEEKQQGCYFPFPIRYVNYYEYAELLPVQVFGWSGHGKTVFLDALRLMLLDMRKVWPDYTYQAITQLDMQKERELRSTLRQGMMPPSTQKSSDLNQYSVYIMLLEKMLRYMDKWLVIMDYPGELFQQFKVNVELMPFLEKSRTTFFIVSIPLMMDDKGNVTGESMDQLLNIYLETMLNLERDSKRDGKRGNFNFSKERRQIVVVLTMADKLIGHLPQSLRRYMQADTTWSRLRSTTQQPFTDSEMADYIKEMRQVDYEIREWLLSDSDGAPGGANLVGLLESHKQITPHYTLMSAVGFEPNEKNPMPIQPKRVLDPFFWALEFEQEINAK